MRGPLRAFVVVAALAACGHAAAPPPPPPPSPPAPPPAPPPPPKCESVDEGCAATDSTHARIQDSGWTIRPPSGWKYAQEASDTFAETKSAAFAVTSDSADEKDPGHKTALARAALRLQVHTKKGTLELPKKPEKVVVVGPLKVSLHQIDHAKRNDKRGAMLVFWTKLPGGGSLLGAGFVADDDDTKADEAILAAVSSLAPSATAGGTAEADGGTQ